MIVGPALEEHNQETEFSRKKRYLSHPLFARLIPFDLGLEPLSSSRC